MDEDRSRVEKWNTNVKFTFFASCETNACRMVGKKAVQRNVGGNGDAIIKKFSKNIVNADVLNTKIPMLAAGLILLSGRRVSELLSGDVRLTEGSTDMSIIFQENASAKPIEVPLLCDAVTFRHGMQVLGKLQGGTKLTRLEAKKKYQAAVTYFVANHFTFTTGDDAVSANDLRYVYSYMAFKKYDYAGLGLTYQEFLTWSANLTSRLAVVPNPDIAIRGANKKTSVSKRAMPPKRWINRIEQRKK